jgi:hypothetical protein
MFASAPTVAARLGTLSSHATLQEKLVSLATILLIALVLMLIGVVPAWPHSRSWGYWPSGAMGLMVFVILLLLLMGRI